MKTKEPCPRVLFELALKETQSLNSQIEQLEIDVAKYMGEHERAKELLNVHRTDLEIARSGYSVLTAWLNEHVPDDAAQASASKK